MGEWSLAPSPLSPGAYMHKLMGCGWTARLPWWHTTSWPGCIHLGLITLYMYWVHVMNIGFLWRGCGQVLHQTYIGFYNIMLQFMDSLRHMLYNSNFYHGIYSWPSPSIAQASCTHTDRPPIHIHVHHGRKAFKSWKCWQIKTKSIDYAELMLLALFHLVQH